MTNQTPESVIAEAMVNAGAPLMHSRVEEGVASALRAANMLREPGVPDAATEAVQAELDEMAGRLSEFLCEVTGSMLSYSTYPAATMIQYTEEYYDRRAKEYHDDYCEKSEKLKEERDAALAAIERVRALLQPTLGGTPTGEPADVCGCGTAYFPCDHAAAIIAALEGAPEPDWEYRARLQSCGFKVEGYVSADYALEELKRELEEHDYLEMDDTAIVERAHVREWLPVEGESE